MSSFLVETNLVLKAQLGVVAGPVREKNGGSSRSCDTKTEVPKRSFEIKTIVPTGSWRRKRWFQQDLDGTHREWIQQNFGGTADGFSRFKVTNFGLKQHVPGLQEAEVTDFNSWN